MFLRCVHGPCCASIVCLALPAPATDVYVLISFLCFTFLSHPPNICVARFIFVFPVFLTFLRSILFWRAFPCFRMLQHFQTWRGSHEIVCKCMRMALHRLGSVWLARARAMHASMNKCLLFLNEARSVFIFYLSLCTGVICAIIAPFLIWR